jgi:hypothetical protein
MNEALEVSGGITMGGLSVLTTGTAYTKDESLTQSEVNDMLNQSLVYIDGQVATLQTQISEIPSPFWVAGKVRGGPTVSQMSTTSEGRYGFTVVRTPSQTRGCYNIVFDQSYANTEYVIVCMVQSPYNYKIAVNAYYPSLVNQFTIATYDLANELVNCDFHFMVIA